MKKTRHFPQKEIILWATVILIWFPYIALENLTMEIDKQSSLVTKLPLVLSKCDEHFIS